MNSMATNLDSTFVHAWLMFGNVFAVCGEHDQAVASYQKAMRCYSKSHVSYLCLCQEMLAMADKTSAMRYLKSAHELCDNDPLVFNEYGVIAFQNKEFSDARAFFEKAASLLNSQTDPSVVELVNNNLAHSLRCLQFVPTFQIMSLLCIHFSLSFFSGNTTPL